MAKQTSRSTHALAQSLLVAIVSMTVIGLVTSRFGWPFYLELLSHFQLQYFVLSVIGVGAIALMRYKMWCVVGLVCTAALATQIIPWYLPPSFAAPNHDGYLRILIANVNKNNQHYSPLLTLIQHETPDLAVFIEVDDKWVEALNVLLNELPNTFGDRGIVLYSRYPVSDLQLRQLSEASAPSILGSITVDGQAIAVVATHPLPPIRPTYFQSRNQQLAKVGQYLATIKTPKMVVGDLNITMWSPYYQRLIRQAGLNNARDGFGLLPSWPTPFADYPLPAWTLWPLSIPIDHCLLSPNLPVANIRVGPNIGSDHRPVIIDVNVGGIQKTDLS